MSEPSIKAGACIQPRHETRPNEQRPLPAVEPPAMSERGIKRRQSKAWAKRMNIVKLLGQVAKGVASWACSHGWKLIAIGQRQYATSVYVHLARRSDKHRVCIRISDHRHPRGVEGVTVEWILPEHHTRGVSWLREWLTVNGKRSTSAESQRDVAASNAASVPQRAAKRRQ